MSSQAAVELVHVRKEFARPDGGVVVAVDSVDLTIGEGEFFSLLGPSGSGKTTVLRLIAGFDEPDGGAILLGGRDVTALAPYDRDVNTVFQDYALFPHMSVQENVEYGLKVKGVGRAERRQRAAEMLDIVRLGDFGSRRPNQMSGGQRQRVALARALVNQPKVLLLDEPLGALDLKLREEMQTELRSIQHQVGITFIFVTHDQGEALSMSTRVAVFNHGRIEQVGTPAEIYEAPDTPFVAGFVGASNVIRDELATAIFGDAAPRSVRPERISVGTSADEGQIQTAATVVDVMYLGAVSRVRTTAMGTSIDAVVSSAAVEAYRAGDEVTLSWSPNAVRELSDPDSAAVAGVDAT